MKNGGTINVVYFEGDRTMLQVENIVRDLSTCDICSIVTQILVRANLKWSKVLPFSSRTLHSKKSIIIYLQYLWINQV
jgi:hypothetical protein